MLGQMLNVRALTGFEPLDLSRPRPVLGSEGRPMAYVATPLKARGMDWIFADNEGQATGYLKQLRLDGITLPKKSLKNSFYRNLHSPGGTLILNLY